MPRIRDALRKSFLERNQRVIGLLAILLLFGGSAFALLLTGGVFASRYHVTAYFSDAAGMKPGDPVTVAGLSAGIVKSLKVDHGLVAMDLAINTGVDMPRDSTANIVVQTLLGKQAGDLVAGSSKADLADGDTIPVARTTTPVNITQLNDISVRLLNHSDAQAFNHFMQELSEISQGKGQDVHGLVTGLADLAQAVDARRSQLSGLIDALKKLSTTLAGKDKTIISLIDNLNPVLTNLANRQQEIRTLLEATDSASHEAASLVRRNRSTLDATLNGLHDDLEVLDQHQLDIAASIQYLNQAVQGYSSIGYSSGFPNRWANIFVQFLGPDCKDSGDGGNGGPLPTPTLPPLPTPSLPPLPTPTLPIPTTSGGLPIPTTTPSLPIPLPTGSTELPDGGGLPLPSPSLPLVKSSSETEQFRGEAALPQDLGEIGRASW